jgi:acetoacetyl-CoA synthetase
VSADAPLWTPSPERAARTRLAAFAGDRDYPVLHEWSVRDPGAFWADAWDFTDVLGDRDSRAIETGDPFWTTRFFPDARLNVAQTLLREPTDDPALLFACEDGARRAVTRAELHELVSRVQQALRAANVGVGDRVVAWLPNAPEVYALMLAAASIGAVFSSTSPDFGVDGVVDRFGQIEPTVLVAADGYTFGGRWFDCRERLREIVARLPSLRTVIVVGDAEDHQSWDDWLAPHSPAAVEFTPLPFDHPWYVLYSSGTTGAPKCIVHRAGGVLLKHLAEHQLQVDVRPGDRVFYFTTAGWMMWNWLASVLGSGATAVVYDGSPTHPSVTSLFDLVDELGITLFGTSARFIDALHKANARPRDTHSLASLRTITSTGSPLSADGFRYVYDAIKSDLHLASISGGTDLCGCLVAGVPTQPVYAGEIQGPGLGMAIDVYGDDGRPLGPGEQGELVCTTPFPSMPLGLWNDPGNERYAQTYFERFPGAWHQGDFAAWTEHGGIVISGRSDATLNPGGVRIGTAEISAQVDKVDGVLESLVIGQEWDGDTRIVCFVVLAPDRELTDELADEIRRRVRSGASPRHVPAKIVAVPDLPRTRSNKLSELAVRDVVHGRAVPNTEALANPDALEYFRDLEELHT